MDDLEDLTDAQLRRRCVEYGFPNVPVTSTTRKILIKKIRNFLKEEKTKRRRQTSYVTTYSSDEEAESKTPSSRRRARATEIIRPVVNVRNHNSSAASSSNSPVQSGNISPKVYVPDPIRSNDFYVNDSVSSSYLSRRTIPNPVYVPHNNHHSVVDGNISSNSDEDEFNTSGTVGENSYTSDFSRRLLNLRAQTLRNSNNFTNQQREIPQVKTQNFTRQSSYSLDRYLTTANLPSLTISKRITSYFKGLGDKYGGSMTPTILITMFVVFMSIVAILYLNKIPDLSKSISVERSFFQLCSEDDELEPHNCVERHSLDAAINLLKNLVPELQERGNRYYCNKGNINSYLMNTRDVIRHLSKLDLYPGPSRTLSNLHTAEYLIEKNPQWKIIMVDGSGAPLEYEDVVANRGKQLEHFIIKNPTLPLTCFVKLKLWTLSVVVGVISIVVFVVYVIYQTVKFIRKYYRAKTEIIKTLAEDIIGELQNRALNESDSSFIAVTHLRDKLIPLNMRKQNETSWNKAIEYLEKHESRIIFDMQIKNGEPFKVIKWIDTHSTSSNHVVDGDNKSNDSRNSEDGNPGPSNHHPHSSFSKQWHSSAFSPSNNKIANPPTECLKIRNMFEKHEVHNPNLKQNILNAILEKCDRCKICDIQLEPDSCCVYLRCATKLDAGIVHNSINGWWFDKHLISIKFLKLERFLCRYPHSMQNKL